MIQLKLVLFHGVLAITYVVERWRSQVALMCQCIRLKDVR